LRRAGLDVWVEGGWGVDALLGEQTRAHDDLDLAVRIEDVGRICETLPEYERSDDEWPASFVLRDADGRKVDCHPLKFDEQGDGWQPNIRSGGAPHRWPRDGLLGSGRIGGVDVPCITAELQIRWHVYSQLDDLDWRDARLLSERFGLDLPQELRERPGFLSTKRTEARLNEQQR
jgi:lincosamide nucleotidyltransferase A/C/D/E